MLLDASNRQNTACLCKPCGSLVFFLCSFRKTTRTWNTSKTLRLYMILGYKILNRWCRCRVIYQHLGGAGCAGVEKGVLGPDTCTESWARHLRALVASSVYWAYFGDVYKVLRTVVEVWELNKWYLFNWRTVKLLKDLTRCGTNEIQSTSTINERVVGQIYWQTESRSSEYCLPVAGKIHAFRILGENCSA